ncbi:MAG: zinc-dependent dehydrogenase [Elusimicrobia bacterium]|nr:zinc-dependent dehydrogenase [Elusimicrobiota bacterium]
MKVAVYYNNKDIRIQEVPVPAIGDDELLLKVMASGICGSDVMEWYRIKKAPIVLGHEAAGVVSSVGKKVKKYKVGDRIFVSHHVPCNECHYCLNGHHTACETLHKTNFYPGGFAEYIRIPKINIDKGTYILPDSMSFEEGTFIEPIGCAVRGQRLLGIKPGNCVLVLGCGMSGILHIQLSKIYGAGKVIAADLNEYRISMAKKFGADYAINASKNISEEILKLNDNRLADAVIVCTGALSASKQALKLADRGGKILFFAVPEPGIDLPIPINDFWRNEMTTLTSYGAAPDDLSASLDLMKSGKIKVKDMITHRFSLDETGLGFKTVAEAKESMKVIIIP